MLTHITFATPNFSQSQRLLQRSARQNGVARSWAYTPDSPVFERLRQQHPDVMRQKRGFGYWLWKPFIIEDAMARLSDGDDLFYTDCGVTFIADPAPLTRYLDSNPVVLFRMVGDGRSQARWTKRDCFVNMGADTPEHWSLRQLCGGFQLYRVGPEAREFVRQLKVAMENVGSLTDTPNVHGDNLGGFVDHRHDQSILTILAHQLGALTLEDPSQYGWTESPVAGEPYHHIFHHHRARNAPLGRYLKRRLFRYYTGGTRFV